MLSHELPPLLGERLRLVRTAEQFDEPLGSLLDGVDQDGWPWRHSTAVNASSGGLEQ